MTLDTNCPDADLAAIVAASQRDAVAALPRLEALAAGYPADGRLWFLLGSMLAGAQRYDEACAAMHRAVETAPGFVLARFQLGFLELTCGRADAALAIWTPLQALDADNPFRLFASGLGHLARDSFDAALADLRLGIDRNSEHPLVNADMQLVIDEVEARRLAPSDASPADSTPSAVELLLERHAFRDPSGYRH